MRLRDVADQTRAQFYLGGSPRSAILRASITITCLILFFKYLPDDQNPLWPLLAFAAIVELVRTEHRVDALNRLFQIHLEHFVGSSGTELGEQVGTESSLESLRESLMIEEDETRVGR